MNWCCYVNTYRLKRKRQSKRNSEDETHGLSTVGKTGGGLPRYGALTPPEFKDEFWQRQYFGDKIVYLN